MSGGFGLGDGGFTYPPTVRPSGGGGGLDSLTSPDGSIDVAGTLTDPEIEISQTAYRLAVVAVMGMLAGDHLDGDVTISGTVTLTRDMYYDNLVVQSGGILNTANYRVYARTVTVDAGGTIRSNGNNASGATGGTALAAGALAAGNAGANGATGAGAASTNTSNQVLPRTGSITGFFRGGAGGLGSGGAGGAAGTVAAFTLGRQMRSGMFTGAGWASGSTAGNSGGNGGGGGGGNGAQAGGGGGAGGNLVYILAGEITNNGAIEVKGGNGAAGLASDCGGGGGGAGGFTEIVCGSYTGNLPDVSGGTGGASGGGSGVAGAAGQPGDYAILEAA